MKKLAELKVGDRVKTIAGYKAKIIRITGCCYSYKYEGGTITGYSTRDLLRKLPQMPRDKKTGRFVGKKVFKEFDVKRHTFEFDPILFANASQKGGVILATTVGYFRLEKIKDIAK